MRQRSHTQDKTQEDAIDRGGTSPGARSDAVLIVSRLGVVKFVSEHTRKLVTSYVGPFNDGRLPPSLVASLEQSWHQRCGVPFFVERDGRRLLIAYSGKKAIDALEISTRATLGHIDLDFAPGRMEALGSGSLSLLNFAAADSPLYVLDSGGDLAVYFVPAGGGQ